ncbi:MAG: hypothetical protein JXA64_00950 [Candidatus Fermentibacteraceae bacterium]|nr:hypothetical protein [Candidatus Fermentibacteraceae bacterium]MBN2607654.1 hypothetical protein [Candidatus Fermentibacteraceae bacterium]
MSARTRNLLTVLSLAAALAAGFAFRSWFISTVMPPPGRMQAETTQAYRYARMFSSRGEIPQLDTLVMHPEGMMTSQNSVFEEYLAGGLHRVTGGDFDDFIGIFCLLFPLLAIIFLFLWMVSAGYERLPALAASSLYGFLLPAILRARGESLYRETVALPMLIALGWLTEKSLGAGEESNGKTYPIAAGILLLGCLAAWKVTAFISFFLLLYLLWRNWRRGDVPFALRISLAAAQIGGSLLLPHMRHDTALLSPATAIAVFLLLPRLKSVWFPLGFTLLAAGSAIVGKGATGHVASVITAKLRFLFSHPEDPSLLSDDARIFWVPGYTSPSPAQVLFLFGIPLLAAAPGLVRFWREKRRMLFFWLLPLSLAGYLFFDRLMIFLAVALLPVIALSFRRRWLLFPVAAVIILQSAVPGRIASLIASSGLEFQDSSSLLNDGELDSFLAWLRNETSEDDAVLSFWHISGLVSAYAQRPVVTHTFFENLENRRTIMRFARSVFMPEDSLVSFMREVDCDLLVYQADFLLDRSSSGLLYLAGLVEVPDSAVAWLLQYRPEGLDSLVPMYQGPSLRVFGFDGPGRNLRRSFLFQERYAHCYKGYDEARAILADPRGWSGYLADRGIEMNDPDMLSGALLLGLEGGGPEDVTGMMLNDLIQLYIRGSYDLDDLAEDVDGFTWFCGPRPDLRLLMGRLYASEGRLSSACDQYRMVLLDDPGNTEASAELRMIIDEMGTLMEEAVE